MGVEAASQASNEGVQHWGIADMKIRKPTQWVLYLLLASPILILLLFLFLLFSGSLGLVMDY